MRNATMACLLLLCSLAAVGQSQTATPPPYCEPCLFYGEDFDASNPAANALTNGIGQGSNSHPAVTFVPFFVPPGQTWIITGLFSNDMSNSSFLEPAKMQWSISTGISAGSAGTTIAKGTISATWTPTGRSWGIFTEYTALGHLTPETAVTITQSGVYWMTAVPTCTDPSCGFAIFYLSDVEDVPAPNHRGTQPNDDSYFLAPADNFFFAPTAYPNGVCNGGGDGTGCDKFSAGLLGYAKPSN